MASDGQITDSLVEKLNQPWRMMCPEKHHNLTNQGGPTVYCEECGQPYRVSELIDKKAIDEFVIVPERNEGP